MKVRSRHSSEELLVRAKIALGNSELIELVEHHGFPNGAQKAAEIFGYEKKEVYSTWALAALKRDYPEIYTGIQTIVEWRANNNCTASTGNAEKRVEIPSEKYGIGTLEQELADSNELLRKIVEQTVDGLILLNEDLRIVLINNAALNPTGYKTEEALGNYCYKITHDKKTPCQSPHNICPVAECKKSGKPVIVEHMHFKKDGSKVFVEVKAEKIVGQSGEIYYIHKTRDITERKQVEEALRESEKRYRELSIVDDLTQLYNSRHFYHQLKIELERSNRYKQPITLMLLDLDNFKAFNDTYGHVEGDEVLRRLGQVIKRCLRETDFAYRYGGEEFTILLPMAISADGAITAERIRTELKKESFFPMPDQEVHMTMSIGLAQYKPSEDMKVFVHRVDQLMYQVKKNGKDNVYSE